MAIAEYGSTDALGLAALVRAGQIAPGELVDEALTRIARTNPAVNAVVHTLDEPARAVAAAVPDGPFRGVPFLVKDLGTPLAGAPLTNGSRYFDGFVPTVDGELFRRYKAAGLLIVGKTNTPELGIQPICEPERHGPTHTPWKIGRTSGGSSGGAGAAVAAGFVPMAHGGDGGGSLRMPASCCGVFALKPSRGRMPVGPERSELWWGLAIEHAITRSVRDSAALLDVTHGAEPGAAFTLPRPERPYLDEVGRPPGRLRVALAKRPLLPSRVHPDCLAAADDAAKLLASLGHDVEEADLAIDPMQFARDFFLYVCVDTATAIRLGPTFVGRPPRARDFETSTWLCNLLGRQRSALELSLARQRLMAIARQAEAFLTRYDVMLSPTLAEPPLPIGALTPPAGERILHGMIKTLGLGALLRLPGAVDAAVQKVFSFMPYTPLANVSGQPSMNLPLYWNGDELPIGVTVTARLGAEDLLFRLAGQVEAARPWAARRPPHAS